MTSMGHRLSQQTAQKRAGAAVSYQRWTDGQGI